MLSESVYLHNEYPTVTKTKVEREDSVTKVWDKIGTFRSQWRIQDFPEGGPQHTIWPIFLQKSHENKDILTQRRWRVPGVWPPPPHPQIRQEVRLVKHRIVARRINASPTLVGILAKGKRKNINLSSTWKFDRFFNPYVNSSFSGTDIKLMLTV